MRLPILSKQRIPDDPDDYRLTLVEHLEELRSRIVRSLVALVVGWFVGWQLVKPMYEYVNARIIAAVKLGTAGKVPIIEVIHSAPDAFFLKLKLSFWIGFTVVFPYIFLQLWGFIAPGLKVKERAALRSVAPWSVVLFIFGAIFAFLITPSAITWFATYAEEFPGIQINQEAGTLQFFILKMLLAFGIAFQLPLVVYILGALELLQAESLLKYWRHSATAIFIIAMVITPSNDPATMLMMAVPLCVMFMVSVYVVKATQAKKRKRATIKGPDDDPPDQDATPPNPGAYSIE